MWALLALPRQVLGWPSSKIENACRRSGMAQCQVVVTTVRPSRGLVAPPSRCRSPAVLGVRAGAGVLAWRRCLHAMLGPLLKTHSHPDFTSLLRGVPNPQGLMF